jgi:ubiquinone biosynthesis protein
LCAKGNPLNSLDLAREIAAVTGVCIKHGLFALPLTLKQRLKTSHGLFRKSGATNSRLLDLGGEMFIRFFDDLGPIYGKGGQIFLSRLTPSWHRFADTLRMTRLYKDWPPLTIGEVEGILDAELPGFRKAFKLDPKPLGIASLAQVHGAEDSSGRLWVVKVIKPRAKERLLQTVAAMEQTTAAARLFALTLVSKRLLNELTDLCQGFRLELSLANERETIEKVHQKSKNRRNLILHIPRVHPEFYSNEALVMERFQGQPLNRVVSGEVEISPTQRKKLARKMLHELLVQVFELGLFHGDPHAGNLMLLENGDVGLYDWGLAGELSEQDRKYIAAILRSVLAMNLEKLVEAIHQMGHEAGVTVTHQQIEKQLKTVIKTIKKAKEGGKKPPLKWLFETCLNAAARLGIPIPEGLLMMVKSLVTIEGLAKGIDPEISIARTATPLLFKAAKPGFSDWLAMGKLLPKMAKEILK